jgi:hypothetical protein
MERAAGAVPLATLGAAALGTLLWTVVPLPVQAQATATTGEIEGSVSDESGAALPAAQVTARNVKTGFERAAASDSRGVYRLSLLPQGPYQLVAHAPGFATLKRGSLELSVGQTRTIHLTLTVASVAESVEVTAEAPPVDTNRSLSATSIDERSIQSLPSNGRRFQDFVLLTPGTVAVGPGAVVSSLGLVSISGQRGLNTTYAVDGADYGEPQYGGIRGSDRSAVMYTISQEALQEIQVTNAGYSAEFGRSGGGVVNAITKSGTNELLGSAFWFFRSEALTANDPFGRPPTDFKQHQFGATLGGPIKQDKAHFFLAYDQQLRRNPFVVKFASDPTGIPGFDGQEGTYTQTNDIVTALARFDVRLSERHQLSVRYSFSHNRAENGSSGSPTDATVAASSLELDTTNTVVAELNSVLSPSRLNALRFQWSREGRASEPNTMAPMVVVTGLGSTGRFFFWPARPSDDRFQLTDTFTLVRGHHSLRFGTDIDLMREGTSYFLPFAGGAYFFASVPDYLRAVTTGEPTAFFIQGFGNPAGRFWQKELAAFVQDTWKAKPNLTVNYGLRYEAHLQPQPDAPNPNLPGNDLIPSDERQVGPRLGVAWDPWKDGRGVLRLNLGLFYSRTEGAAFYTAFVENGFARVFLPFPPGFPGAPRFPDILPARPPAAFAPPPGVYVIDPGFRNPRTLQASLGIEREILPGLTLSADVIRAGMRFLRRLRDTNILPASGNAPDGRLVYPSERPNPAFQEIEQLESSAKGAYEALTLGVKKHWRGDEHGRGLQFQAFYTYARNKDDDSSERNASLSILYQDWQNLAAEYTWSDNDVRHSLVLNGTCGLPWGLEVAAIFAARSGTPYSHISGNDLNNDGNFGNDRQFIGGADTGRNSYRQPGYSRLDLRLGKSVGLGGRRRLDLALDIFNAFNAKNLVVSPQNQMFDGSEPGTLNPALDRPDSQAGEPRSAQVSLRFRF